MTQNYRNHKRFDLLYHVVTLLALLALLTGSVVNLVHTSREGLYSSSLLVLVAFVLVLLYFFVRRFPLKVQDRAIRAEEDLRYYILTGKQLDQQLTMGQIIALRFASDEEFIVLARRAVEEALSGDEIKREIRNWRADHFRV